MFIVLEGIDGSGKSVQGGLLADYLKEKGKDVLLTREPSLGPVGQLVRSSTHKAMFDRETMALLFAADRVHHYNTEIAPFLSQGGYVVCDRYYFSNAAYQSFDEASLERILSYNQCVINHPAKQPDIIFFIDVPPETCMERITQNRNEKSIFETLPQLRNLRERYLKVFESLQLKGKLYVIEAGKKSKLETLETLKELMYTHLANAFVAQGIEQPPPKR